RHGRPTWSPAPPSGSFVSGSGRPITVECNWRSGRSPSAAGNSTAGTGHSYTLDQTAPTAVATVTAIGADTGSSASDYITSTASQELKSAVKGTHGDAESSQVRAEGGHTGVTARQPTDPRQA